MKRHLPAFLAASKASMAPPGANTLATSSLSWIAVDLPEVDVVGPEPLQRAVELVLGPPAGPLGGLGGEEDALADLGQDLAVDLLGAAVPVDVGGVEVVDAQLDGPPGQRDRLVGRDQREAAAGQADDGELDAGLAERPPGDLAGLGEGFPGMGRPGAGPANSPPTKPPMRVLRLMGVLRSDGQVAES